MTQPLDRDQFRTAFADAVTGVLNVYREVDTMLRDLTNALNEDEPRVVPLVRRLVPGAGSKNPDARYLRNYIASVFVPVDSAEDEVDEDDEDEDGEEGDEDEDESTSKPKRMLTVKVGSALLFARAALYDRSRPAFEPSLIVGSLSRCRVEGDVAVGTPLKTKAGRIKKIFRAIDAHRAGSDKPLVTSVTAQVPGPKSKNVKLMFDPPRVQTYPLYEVSAGRIPEVAAALRALMGSAAASTAK